MVNFIRIVSFLIAILIAVISIFYIDAEQELARAQRAFDLKDMDQSLRMARRANAAFSENDKKVDAYFLQARAAAKMDRIEKAKTYLDRMLSINQNNPQGLLFRGKIEVLLGENQLAVNDINKGFELAADKFSKPTMAYYLTQRGYANLALNQINEAEKDAQKAMNFMPKLSISYDLMSKVLEQRGDIKGALDECEKAYNLAKERNQLFFTTPEGRELSDRYINLQTKYLLSK